MTHILKKISIRLLVCTLITIPLGFYLAPGFEQLFPDINMGIIVVIIAASLFIIAGYLMDKIGVSLIKRHLKEAHIWEKAGIKTKAEKSYTRALRAYDSFLPGIFTNRKKYTKLLELGVRRQDTGFRKQELGEEIPEKVVRKEDLKLGTESISSHTLSENLESLGKWQEQISEKTEEKPTLLSETDMPVSRLSSFKYDIDGELEEDIQEKTLYKTTLEQRRIKPSIRKQDKITENNKNIFFYIPAAIFKYIRNVAVSFRYNEKIRFLLKAAIIIILLASIGFIGFNTISHILGSRYEEKTALAPTPHIIKQGFNVQIGAYLKMEYAQKHVNLLKDKNIDAKIQKIEGGGKTWFVVRISGFQDKQSATDYGQELKQKGIINDFFVTRYTEKEHNL